MSTTSAVTPSVSPGTSVFISPANGNPWVGTVCNPAYTVGGDLVVQCLDPRDARGLVKGSVYAVLPRFVALAAAPRPRG